MNEQMKKRKVKKDVTSKRKSVVKNVTEQDVNDIVLEPVEFSEEEENAIKYTTIIYRTRELIKALTNRKYTPTQDVLFDLIRPTREFRKGLYLELNQTERAYLWNYLGMVYYVIDDMIDIMDELEKKNE
jgi:hypothetical protein